MYPDYSECLEFDMNTNITKINKYNEKNILYYRMPVLHYDFLFSSSLSFFPILQLK